MEEPRQEHQRMGRVMQVFAWLAVMALLMLYFGDVLERQRNPNRSVDTEVTAAGVREVELKRNRMGHYVSAGTINGEEVVFLLDTGATGVAIPAALAERLSLPKGRPIMTNTANGSTRSYLTRLDEVAVGDIRLQNVEASITPGLQMREVLLGMSFLKHIEFTQRGNTLTLRQYL
ncbi:TIGR02281 family clan AA aspartic protease [Congregibacter brevis]|uniref:TIGR02281 family clan AA aspartic protease n=1 Tax=Congregibacter brevis TaxID=3081201 RepID=A0ABZ0IE40_9GAMM|nr:TIGR02281 family clan AA aspartic protease [Congregibacter sp. IMCC45268]